MLVEFACNMSKRGIRICVRQVSTGEKALQGESTKEKQGLRVKGVEGNQRRKAGGCHGLWKLESEGEDFTPEGMVSL